jgi:hypothetical protein
LVSYQCNLADQRLFLWPGKQIEWAFIDALIQTFGPMPSISGWILRKARCIAGAMRIQARGSVAATFELVKENADVDQQRTRNRR